MAELDWDKFGEGVLVLNRGSDERAALCARDHDGQFDADHCWACAWRKVREYVMTAAELHESGVTPRVGGGNHG
jgi:hypothetical protein